MKNEPTKIYLQAPYLGDDYPGEFPELETTWSKDRQNEEDIGPYVKQLDRDLIPVSFQFRQQFESMDTTAITIHRMNSPFYKGEKWAVRRYNSCLAKDGEWEVEASPSNRDDDFYKRCRFDTIKEAANAAKESGGL